MLLWLCGCFASVLYGLRIVMLIGLLQSLSRVIIINVTLFHIRYQRFGNIRIKVGSGSPTSTSPLEVFYSTACIVFL